MNIPIFIGTMSLAVSYHKILYVFPCAIQYNLVHLFCICLSVCAHFELPVCPVPRPSRLATTSLFSICMSLFLFCIYVLFCSFFSLQNHL